MSTPAQIDLSAVLAKLAELEAKLDRPAAAKPLVTRQADAPAVIGVSRPGLFRLKHQPGFPKPIKLPGCGICFRTADLEAWVASRPAKKGGGK